MRSRAELSAIEAEEANAMVTGRQAEHLPYNGRSRYNGLHIVGARGSLAQIY
jgi:hypothetical protein